MATIVVTTNLESDSGDGLTSLREAVAQATLTAAADTITFDASLAGQTIVLTQGEVSITRDLTVNGDTNGDGRADVTISGNNASRIFNQSGNGTDVDLQSLTLTDGYDPNMGGAMFVLNGTLDIVDTTIKNSRAGTGAGLYLDYAAVTITNSLIAGNDADFNGGGVYIYGGTTVMTNTTVTGNTSGGYGGGIFAGSDNDLTLQSSTVAGNRADADGTSTTDGGGISFQAATLALTNSVVTDNFSGRGAVENDVRGTVDTAAGSVFGTDVVITTNLASVENVAEIGLDALADNGGTVLTLAPLGGSVLIDAGRNASLPADPQDLDGDGNVSERLPEDGRGGARVIGGRTDVGAVEQRFIVVTTAEDVVDAGDGVLSLREAVALANATAVADTIVFTSALAGQTLVLTGGELALTRDTVIRGDTNGDGKADITISGNGASRIFEISGGTTDVDLTGLTLTDGYDFNGGAIRVQGGTLDIVNSTLRDNAGGYGGALRADGATVRILSSTLNANTASRYGGAIYGSNGSSITLTNATVHGNQADALGGGISSNASTLTVLNSTVTANRADADGSSITSGGGLDNFIGTLVIANSVVADNLSGSAGNGALENDVSGAVSTATNSVFGTGVAIDTDGGGNQTGIADVGLGQLLDNGGTVLTRSPLDGSVLIGAGGNTSILADVLDADRDGDVLEPLPLDGRGGGRVVGSTVDVGAVEQILQETIRGTAANDAIFGGRGGDRLFGEAGRDTLDGGQNNDALDGGTGKDSLSGADGADKLIGGGDKDVLTGGTGRDLFIFKDITESRAGAARDRIIDFTQGSDRIDLRAIDADSDATGNQAFSFRGALGFTGAGGELRFVQANGKTIVSGDIDGDRTADFQIELDGLVALNGNPGGDFIL